MDLVAFLLARISEDEAVAREAIDPDRPGTHWHWVMDATDTPVADGHLQRAQDDGESVSLRTVEEYPTRNGWSLPHFVVESGEVHGTGGEHIARWDPARVLAECESKRRILKLHESWPVLVEGPPEWQTPPSGLDDVTFRVTRQMAWLTQQEYRQRFGDEPPTTPMLRALALPYADHEDFDERWRP